MTSWQYSMIHSIMSTIVTNDTKRLKETPTLRSCCVVLSWDTNRGTANADVSVHKHARAHSLAYVKFSGTCLNESCKSNNEKKNKETKKLRD